MRGRASGFGVRISSMEGLLIVTFANGDISKQVTGQLHRADNLLNELDLGRRDVIFCVQFFVRPSLCPLLRGHEGVNLACGVLRWLVQKNQKASQPTGEVGQDTFGLDLRVERPNIHICPRRDASRLTDEWCTDDPVRVGVSVASTRSSATNEDFPLVEDSPFLLNFRSCDVSNPTVPVDLKVIT